MPRQHCRFQYLFVPPNKSNTEFLFIALAVIPFFFFAYFNDKKKAHDEYVKIMTEEYPELVSKLSLLYSAGMTIFSALNKICTDYEIMHTEKNHPLYDNLRHSLSRINQGCSEADEYKLFGKKCIAPCYIRFGNLLYRNLIKGSADLEIILQNEVITAYENEKQQILRKSGEAETKMLLPMILIFVVILIIIMIPALSSVSLNNGG